MSDETLEVRIAVYLIPDLARDDFTALAGLAEAKTISAEGIVLVVKDADGELHVDETADHLGRKGVALGGGVGLVVGLFAPPLLAATAVGAALGGVTARFARKRIESGIGEKLDESLPPNSAGIIAIYDHSSSDLVAKTLANTIRTSTAEIDKASAKELKAGLEEAGAALAG